MRFLFFYLVYLCRQDEIIFGEAVYGVCGELDSDIAPGDREVRVMALLLGDRRNFVYKLHSLFEVFKVKALGEEPRIIKESPVGELREQFFRFFARHGFYPTLARHALLFSQSGHITKCVS